MKNTVLWGSLTVFACIVMLGCGQSQQQSDASKSNDGQVASTPTTQPATNEPAPAQSTQNSQPGTQPAQVAQQPAQKPAATKPATTTPTAAKPAVKEPEPPKMVTIPTGTSLVVALETHLRTDSNQVGDAFVARTTDAIRVDEVTVIPAGTEVRGSLTQVEEPHRTAGKAQMTLAFEQLIDGSGQSHAISAAPIVLEGEPDKINDEKKVAGGAVIGGVIGALTSKNKGKGALKGAAAGAVAGGAVALATKGKQIDLPPGQQFSIELNAPVQVPASQLTAGK